MLSLIRLGTISLIMIIATFLMVHYSIANERVLPQSGILSEKPISGNAARELYEGEIIAFKQYRASGYVAPFSGSLGRIIGKLNYWTALNEGNVVFIDIGTNKGAKVGDHFSIISRDRSVIDPVKIDGLKYIRPFHHQEQYLFDEHYRHDLFYSSPLYLPDEEGRLVRNVGILKITETSSDKSKAVILSSNDAIYIGDAVGEFSFEKPAMVSTTYIPAQKNVRGHLLAHKLLSPTVDGDGEIMYINVGAAQNVEVGDRFMAYLIPETENIKINDGDITPMMEHNIGEMVVVRVKQNTATVKIIKSDRSLTPGTRVKSK
ncbi:MAG: hypothetical protein ACQ9MH_03840 [Nitrospinales bacterium]